MAVALQKGVGGKGSLDAADGRGVGSYKWIGVNEVGCGHDRGRRVVDQQYYSCPSKPSSNT